MRLVFVLSLLALPAQAEAPGPVERMVLAHRLAAAGADQRDGLSQLAGARLATGITLQRLDLKRKSRGRARQSLNRCRIPQRCKPQRKRRWKMMRRWAS